MPVPERIYNSHYSNVYLLVLSSWGKRCRKPHCRNGVVDTFGLFVCLSLCWAQAALCITNSALPFITLEANFRTAFWNAAVGILKFRKEIVFKFTKINYTNTILKTFWPLCNTYIMYNLFKKFWKVIGVLLTSPQGTPPQALYIILM